MKRFVLPVGALILLIQLTGCGSDSPPPADGSNLPSEVKDFEARRETERAKKIMPAAPPHTATPGPR
jgi:predicted small lipoprotein YifL